jgi:hypothetical protein
VSEKTLSSQVSFWENSQELFVVEIWTEAGEFEFLKKL